MMGYSDRLLVARLAVGRIPVTGLTTVVLALLMMLPICLVEPAPAGWSREFAPEIDFRGGESPHQMVVFDGRLVLSGPIDQIGARKVGGVTFWDGEAWRAFGDGPRVQPWSLVPWRGHLFVAGLSSNAGRRWAQAVAEWDGRAWTEVEEGLKEAWQLTIWKDRLVVVEGLCYGKVFLLDRNRWVELKGLPPGASVLCLAATGEDLYAVTSEQGILRWTGSGWVPHGPDPGGAVLGMWATTDGLVVQTRSRGGESLVFPRPRVLASSDTVWLPLPAETQPYPRVVGTWNGRVLLANRDSLLVREERGWRPLRLPFEGSIHKAVGDGDRLWVLFERHVAPGVVLTQVLLWKGNAWTELGTGKGVGGSVAAFYSEGNRLLVAGWFERCGLLPARNLACWDGGQWAAFDTSGGRWIRDSTICRPDGIASLAVWQGSLYAGGDFTIYGTPKTKPRNLARWDGTAWRPAGGRAEGCEIAGIPARAKSSSLAATPAGMAVAGNFCDWDNQRLNGIGLWDGTFCHPLGDGPGCDEPEPFCHPRFTKVVSFGSGLVAVGTLRSPDGPRKIGWWNGAVWSFMDGGTDGQVTDLMEWEGWVVAAGSFLRAGDVFTRNIAVWDGEHWSALGEGLPDPVVALGLYRDRVVAATSKPPRGPQPLSALWTWTGSEWIPFMGGAVFEGEVGVLHEHQGDLYVGGRFGSVNGILSESIARWTPE